MKPAAGNESFFGYSAYAATVTTSLSINICGNGNVEPSTEVCDDGVNNGLYSVSIAGRNCNSDCKIFAPYCGDSILQPIRGEACDDGNNIAGDGCNAICAATEETQTGSGGLSGTFFAGGLTGPPPTRVIVSGEAYPGTRVNILKDGVNIGNAQANTDADFSFETSNMTPGVSTFGFWANDRNGTRSITFTVTLSVVANAATTISGVLLPPTITLNARQLKPGDALTMSGVTVPQAEVETRISTNPETIIATSSNEAGTWQFSFDTAGLAPETFYTAKPLFRKEEGGRTLESGFGQSLSFFVGEGEGGEINFVVRADVNNDNKINLVDFSILLFHWGTSNAESDINFDGVVNLTDFSIMLFRWTG